MNRYEIKEFQNEVLSKEEPGLTDLKIVMEK
jgi:hypothetical protein